MTGILTVDDVAATAANRRYILPPAHVEVLVNRASPAYLGALGHITDMTAVLTALTDSFRDGTGVPWAQYGDGARTMQAELNRPGYLTQLAQEWLPAMPDIEDRLHSVARCRVADVACGTGWSAIALATAYPNVVVDAFDADDASIAEARRNAAEAGVADRVRFEVRDAADPGLPERSYDLVTAFECIHDLPEPVEALAAMRRLTVADGFVLVADNAVGRHTSTLLPYSRRSISLTGAAKASSTAASPPLR